MLISNFSAYDRSILFHLDTDYKTEMFGPCCQVSQLKSMLQEKIVSRIDSSGKTLTSCTVDVSLHDFSFQGQFLLEILYYIK